MAVRGRRGWTVGVLALVFASGWATGRWNASHASARRDTPGPGSASATEHAGAEAIACTDRLAMQANANLVEQVHGYRAQLEVADRHAHDLDHKLTAAADAPPARLVTSREEWARMAREGTIRMRVPCARWNAVGRFTAQSRRGHSISAGSTRGFETGRRVDAAGLSDAEQETLDEVYARTHARAWAAMRTACEANADVREAIADREDPTDQARAWLCSRHVLNIGDPATRSAFVRVAELHAAGAGIERASTDEQRVAFALTDTPATLHAEMVKALGVEKTTRAIDNGIACLDESLYDLREPEPPPPPEPEPDG